MKRNNKFALIFLGFAVVFALLYLWAQAMGRYTYKGLFEMITSCFCGLCIFLSIASKVDFINKKHADNDPDKEEDGADAYE